MISVIITSWKEPNTIGKCIRCIANREYSGIKGDFEIIQLSPDNETLDVGMKEAKSLKLSNNEYSQIRDPMKGKPYALKLAFKKAKGDILVLTDGDTYFKRNTIKYLLEPFEDKDVGGVSGRPMSMDRRDNMFGYWGHLLSDSAHHRRTSMMEVAEDKGYYKSNTNFYPMSGYIIALRNILVDLPENVLSDDAYISYDLRNKGYHLAYSPRAVCYVKFPTNLDDYYKQKVRSIGGFIQLKKFDVFKKDKQSRSFLIELRYSLFVLLYAKNIREFVWSIYLFPVRLVTWIKIYWEQNILHKDMPKAGWARIESTK